MNCTMRSSVLCGSLFSSRHILRSMLGIALLAALLVTPQVWAQAAQLGQWQILTNTLPLNPVHAALMHNGKVLMIEGKNTVPNPVAAVWDPATQTATTFPATYTMFCSGMVVLPDGRPLVVGGTTQFPPAAFTGIAQAAIYDPATGVFTNQPNMADGRWYPSATELSDGRVMVFSGTDQNGKTDPNVEIFAPSSPTGSGTWTAPAKANFVPPLYPRMHVLPNGLVFNSGLQTQSKFYNPATNAWTNCCTTNFPNTRGYGTSVLFPLTPSNGYKPVVMIMGGGRADNVTPATNTTELIDLSLPTPAWTWGPNMSQARIDLNATILPTGNILVTGGSAMSENASMASLNADLYHTDSSDKNFGKFTSAGANSVPRLYHSNAILLPDATVILTGSNPETNVYDNRVELYQPAYLFNADGTLATRPTITSVTGAGVFGKFLYNNTFTIKTPDTASIARVSLIRPSAPTHSFDMDQRMVRLTFSVNASAGTLTVHTPPNANIAPPGYYEVFILNAAGVPSIAQFIQLCPTTGCL
jgi:Domain of unknown function (DUF1929)